jgi:cyclic pyranopterin phosphate synthase
LAFTGGTGATADDVTPESLLPLLDRRFEGFELALHAEGRVATPRAPLSRLVVGARNRTLVLALPGSPGAVTDALRVLEPMLVHLLKLMAGHPDPH